MALVTTRTKTAAQNAEGTTGDSRPRRAHSKGSCREVQLAPTTTRTKPSAQKAEGSTWHEGKRPRGARAKGIKAGEVEQGGSGTAASGGSRLVFAKYLTATDVYRGVVAAARTLLPVWPELDGADVCSFIVRDWSRGNVLVKWQRHKGRDVNLCQLAGAGELMKRLGFLEGDLCSFSRCPGGKAWLLQRNNMALAQHARKARERHSGTEGASGSAGTKAESGSAKTEAGSAKAKAPSKHTRNAPVASPCSNGSGASTVAPPRADGATYGQEPGRHTVQQQRSVLAAGAVAASRASAVTRGRVTDPNESLSPKDLEQAPRDASLLTGRNEAQQLVGNGVGLAPPHNTLAHGHGAQLFLPNGLSVPGRHGVPAWGDVCPHPRDPRPWALHERARQLAALHAARLGDADATVANGAAGPVGSGPMTDHPTAGLADGPMDEDTDSGAAVPVEIETTTDEGMDVPAGGSGCTDAMTDEGMDVPAAGPGYTHAMMDDGMYLDAAAGPGYTHAMTNDGMYLDAAAGPGCTDAMINEGMDLDPAACGDVKPSMEDGTDIGPAGLGANNEGPMCEGVDLHAARTGVAQATMDEGLDADAAGASYSENSMDEGTDNRPAGVRNTETIVLQHTDLRRGCLAETETTMQEGTDLHPADVTDPQTTMGQSTDLGMQAAVLGLAPPMDSQWMPGSESPGGGAREEEGRPRGPDTPTEEEDAETSSSPAPSEPAATATAQLQPDAGNDTSARRATRLSAELRASTSGPVASAATCTRGAAAQATLPLESAGAAPVGSIVGEVGEVGHPRLSSAAASAGEPHAGTRAAPHPGAVGHAHGSANLAGADHPSHTRSRTPGTPPARVDPPASPRPPPARVASAHKRPRSPNRAGDVMAPGEGPRKTPREAVEAPSRAAGGDQEGGGEALKHFLRDLIALGHPGVALEMALNKQNAEALDWVCEHVSPEAVLGRGSRALALDALELLCQRLSANLRKAQNLQWLQAAVSAAAVAAAAPQQV